MACSSWPCATQTRHSASNPQFAGLSLRSHPHVAPRQLRDCKTHEGQHPARPPTCAVAGGSGSTHGEAVGLPEPHASTSSSTRGKGIVITGGTKGLGLALAHEYLCCGDTLVICGQNAERLAAALATLRQQHGANRVHGIVCNVSSASDVERLAEFAASKLPAVDIWINNAGRVTANRLLADVEPGEIAAAVGTNVLGSLLGSRAAVRLMRRQPAASQQPAFHIFNCGFSGWGAKFSKSAATHKSTKLALTQLNESLVQELAAAGITSIGVHNLSPGMVLTDLLLDAAADPGARRAFNALAEEPETVAAALAPRIRAVEGRSCSISYLTPAGAALRMLTRLPEVVWGGRFFDAQGRRVQQPGQRYQPNGVRIQL